MIGAYALNTGGHGAGPTFPCGTTGAVSVEISGDIALRARLENSGHVQGIGAG